MRLTLPKRQKISSMKLFSITLASSALAQSCPDSDLQTRCEDFCNAELAECYGACSSSSCQYECLGEAARCGAACPCNDECPQGCAGCANPVCSCKDLHLNGEHEFCVDKFSDEHAACMKVELCQDFFQSVSRLALMTPVLRTAAWSSKQLSLSALAEAIAPEAVPVTTLHASAMQFFSTRKCDLWEKSSAAMGPSLSSVDSDRSSMLSSMQRAMLTSGAST